MLRMVDTSMHIPHEYTHMTHLRTPHNTKRVNSATNTHVQITKLQALTIAPCHRHGFRARSSLQRRCRHRLPVFHEVLVLVVPLPSPDFAIDICRLLRASPALFPPSKLSPSNLKILLHPVSYLQNNDHGRQAGDTRKCHRV